jgi:hypothetical protein
MMKMKMKQGDMEKEAKLRLLEKLSQEMSDLMSEQGMDEEEMPEGMQKVTVAAPDEEGLEEGLEAAGQIVKKGPESLEALAGLEKEPEFSLDDLDSEELSMFEDEEDEE